MFLPPSIHSENSRKTSARFFQSFLRLLPGNGTSRRDEQKSHLGLLFSWSSLVFQLFICPPLRRTESKGVEIAAVLWVKGLFPNSLEQGWTNFFLKRGVVHIFSFAGYAISVNSIQLCHCSMKTAIDNM